MTPLDRKEIILDIFKASLQAVDPAESVRQAMPDVITKFGQEGLKEIIIVGFGKASVAMGKAALGSLPDTIPVSGILLTKYGHVLDTTFPASIEVFEAGHPIPDDAGVNATRKIIELLEKADERILVLYLISGGGSALLTAPAEGISLTDKQAVTNLLLKAGATVHELNTVRKHLSRVKGGALAKIAYPARGIALILSDVIGDNLDIIASGPTAPDTSTFADTINVLRKYSLLDQVPVNVMTFFGDGYSGAIPDTPKKDDPAFTSVENNIIANNRSATAAAAQKASEYGYVALSPANNIQGEARVVAGRFAQAAISTKKRLAVPGRQGMCFVYGGETTVTVTGNGVGGRNTEMALAFALAIAQTDGITFLAAGTDGTDGPTDAAGAIVDGRTIPDARAKDLSPEVHLSRNDSYNFFKEAGGLVITGPTGTNVMDLYIALIESFL